MEIIDNFLSDDEFESLSDVIMKIDFPWFWSESVVDSTVREELHQYLLVHMFFADDLRGKLNLQEANTNPIMKVFGDMATRSPYLKDLNPILKKLGVKELYRIKANLNASFDKNYGTGFHIDFPDIKTSVYYMDTNDGYTEFETGEKVKSVANRMVIFDSNMRHQGVHCTDSKRRVVINFNFTI